MAKVLNHSQLTQLNLKQRLSAGGRPSLARRLTDAEFTALVKEQDPKRWVYPWDQWLNGEYWLLERGYDFKGHTQTFRTRIYDKQRRWGQIRTHKITDNSILIKRETRV